MEIIIIGAIVFFVITTTKMIDVQEIFDKDGKVVSILKEKDYDFYAITKYGSDVDIDKHFNRRIKNASLVFILVSLFLIFNFSWINLSLGIIAIFLTYKNDYMNLKKYYKRNLQRIDQLLPYYLKSIEILAQHYTIPVAISKSINTAPDVFKVGLRKMINRIDSGDSSIDPYMEFAKDFPVRDSMRMMRLLYRLSIGAQENKQEQLLVFSKSVSSLQNKSREKMYAARLKKMENKTLIMLVVTGGGTMIVILFAMMSMLM